MDRSPPELEVIVDQQAVLQDLLDLKENMHPDVAGRLGPVDVETWVPRTLIIQDDTFAPDFFVQTAWFVSKRLREVMELGSDVAQYLPINTDQCHEAGKRQDYMIMDTFAVREAIDPVRSDIEFMHHGEADAPQVLSVENIVWREDFVADVPIFRDPRDQRFFATDAFAERVMRAGITDMVFQDVTSEQAQHELVLKTL
ncbi:MAG: imm11 family protein [Geminicoccaceae bacterium]